MYLLCEGDPRRSESDLYQQLLRDLFVEDGSFWRLLGLSRSQFDELLNRVGESLTLQDTNYRRPIPAAVRLCIGLRYLRSGNNFHNIAETFRVAQSSVCKIVPQVVAALWEGLKEEFLSPLDSHRWRSVSDGFRTRWDFPLCCGALDGRQVVLRAPPRYGAPGQRAASVVLLAVVDSDSRFLVVESSCRGAERRGTQPHVFVSDETFTLRTTVMRPYTGQFVSPLKRIFNRRLARAHSAAADAFRRLASHWGLYRRPAEVRPEWQSSV
ncbi:hypothetical protein WMY93_033541 [Mugilogobius chulae]|uniref:DDE Tnp4 domain-containing protein n=1 Tax=Mugilogobius chulae TaxID=88201 RepID=A0AAW0MNK3_9GOBI